MPEIIVQGSDLVVRTRYDRYFLSEFKGLVPSTMRHWNKHEKTWTVHISYLSALKALIEDYFGFCDVVHAQGRTPKAETRTITLEYIGLPKLRNGENEATAFGRVDGEWSIIFPESVLVEFFGGQSSASTLYGVLGVSKRATEMEIKLAYKRAIRTYHPDVYKEVDGPEIWLSIQQAYEVIGNPIARKKYDAGLALVTSLNSNPTLSTWRPPVRCGILSVKGKEVVGRFVVSKILSWEDDTRNGLTRVASWDVTLQDIRTEWV